MVTIAFAYYSLISSRNSFLLLILLGLTCYAANQKQLHQKSKAKSKAKTFLMMGCIAAFILAVSYAITIQRYSNSDSAYAQERLRNVSLYMLDGAFGNDEALLWMQENDYSLLGGKTYLAGITNVIPRSWWADKPLGGGPELINMIYPGSYVIGAAANNSLTTGLLTEMMMNFGILGLPFAIIVWSILGNYFVYRALRSRTVVLRTFFVILIASLSSAFLYSEFLGFMVRIGAYLMPVLLISGIFPRLGQQRSEPC